MLSPGIRFKQSLQTLAAFIALFVALTLPNRLEWVSPQAFLYFPLELMVISLLLLLPGHLGNMSRIVLSTLLGLGVLLRAADLVTHEIFARPVNVVFDAQLLVDGNRLLAGVLGEFASIVVALLLIIGVALVCVLVFAVLGQIQRTLRMAPRVSAVALLVLLVSWNVVHGAGWSRSGSFAWDQLLVHSQNTIESIRDIRRFAETVAEDDWDVQPPQSLFSRLRGKDVFIVFAESYGRVLLERDPFQKSVTATLKRLEESLATGGVHMRSAFLTSPTVGGLSWLAHASVLSGAWIDSETRYKTLMLSDRVTLNRLFREAGWRTVAAMPAISMAWPEGGYYGYDKIYNAHNLGYQGLPFNWVTMPDQYVLSAIESLERAPGNRPPVMVEFALISSHAPWTPIARLVPWEQVGDGRIFDQQALSGLAPEVVWRDTESIRYHYRESIEYMLETMVSYILEHGDENLVVVLLGDHQPAPLVSGDSDGKQVPVHLLSRDPEVVDAMAAWNWQPGLIPGSDAPVWPMNEFRDRFVTAYSELQNESGDP